MGKFDGILLCSDIDGTLTARAGEISDANRAALEYFTAEGGRFTLATGRFYRFAKSLGVPVNAPYILINGTAVQDERDGRILWERHMTREDVELCVKICNEDERVGAATCCDRLSDHNWKREDGPLCMEQLAGLDLHKFLFRGVDPEQTLSFTQDMAQKYAGVYQIDRSCAILLELHPLDSGKGAAAAFLRRYLPDVTCVIGAGDYENDRTLAEEADLFFAPENAIDSIKALATAVLPDHMHSTMQALVEWCERERVSERFAEKAAAQKSSC